MAADTNFTEGLVHQWFRRFVSEECADIILIENDFTHIPCLQLLFSKLLSYILIILITTLMKTPQIMKIWKAKSGKGVNLYSQLIALFTTSMNITYSTAKEFPLSLWAESIGLGLQTLCICYLIMYYEGNQKMALSLVIAYFVIMAIMLSSFVPLWVHIFMYFTIAIPMAPAGKINQIIATYRLGAVGQLSFIYMGLAAFRSLGRLVTVMIEKWDRGRIIDLSIKCSLSCIQLFLMIFYYFWPSEDEISSKQCEEKGRPPKRAKKGRKHK